MGELPLQPLDNDPGGAVPQDVSCPKCDAVFRFYAASQEPESLELDQNTAGYMKSKAAEALGASCPDHVDKFIY